MPAGGATFAGVPLLMPKPDLVRLVAKHIDPARFYEFAYRDWPGPRQAFLSWSSQHRVQPIRIGSLSWPAGASRWAVGHFLASENQLSDIRPLALLGPGNSGQPVSQELFLSSGGDNQITADMYLLPPRPIRQFLNADGDPALNGLYLLTLVDDRFFWWNYTSDKLAFDGSATWDDIYDALALQLGINIGGDDVDASYLRPSIDSALIANYEAIPPLLDALAYNCGQRIVRQMDGTVEAINFLTSGVRALENLPDDVAAHSGGQFTTIPDMAGVLPSSVKVTFPLWEDGVPKYQTASARPDDVDYWEEEVELSSIGTYADLTGAPGSKTFHDTCHATLAAGGSTPTNQGDLQALALRTATDFYGHITAASLDVAYNGILDWTFEGLHDLEWTYRLEDVSTRVMRREWNLDPEELMHADGTGAPILPVGGLGQQVLPFTSQLLTVTSSTPVDTNLYPATLTYYTRNSVTPNTSAACYLLNASGGSLKNGNYREAIPNGRWTVGGVTKPLYITASQDGLDNNPFGPGEPVFLNGSPPTGSGSFCTLSPYSNPYLSTTPPTWNDGASLRTVPSLNFRDSSDLVVHGQIANTPVSDANNIDNVCAQNVWFTISPTAPYPSGWLHNLLSATHPDTTPHVPGVGSLVVGNSGGTSWIFFAGNSGTLRYLTEDSGGSPQWLPSMIYAIDSSFGCTTGGSLFTETLKGPQPRIALAGSCYITCQVAETAGTNTDNDPDNWGKLTFSVYWCGFQVSDGSGTVTTKVDRLDFGTDFKLTPSSDASCTTDNDQVGAHKKIAVALDNCGLAGSPFEGDDTSDMCDVSATATLNSDCTITITLTKKYRRKTYCHGRLWAVGSCLVSP